MRYDKIYRTFHARELHHSSGPTRSHESQDMPRLLLGSKNKKQVSAQESSKRLWPQRVVLLKRKYECPSAGTFSQN